MIGDFDDYPPTHTPEAVRHPDGCESCARPSTEAGRRILAQFHGWPDRPEYPWNLLDADDIIEIERQAATVSPATHDTPEATIGRFWSWVDRRSPIECWEWRGYLTRSNTGGGEGYGRFSLGHRSPVAAHRFAYEQIIGPIPAGMQLDHLCSNRACVNPSHLEPVTAGENSRRAMSGRRALLCRNGHPLTPDNEIVFGGVRRCHICSILKTRRAYRRRKGLPADYPVRQ